MGICKYFEITITIYSNSESSPQVLKQDAFLTCSWRFFRYDKLLQLEFKLEKNIGIQKHAGKVRKNCSCDRENLLQIREFTGN